MSSQPPLILLTDTQADTPGSPSFYSPHYSHSPQPSPISPSFVQTPEVDAGPLWHEAFYDASVFPPKPDLRGIFSYFLDEDVVEHHTPYNPHTPLTIDPFTSNQPSMNEYDGGSTPSLSVSSDMLSSATWSPCICGCGGSACLPQRPYRRPKGDPLDDAHLGELIEFRVHGQCGIPLTDALRCVYGGLAGRDEPMFIGSRSSISIRLEWPDCPSWAQQMRTKDWRRKPNPITKAKLATEVAKKVERFLMDMRPNRRGSQGDTVSPCDIDISRLTLVALEHVSIASWQPHLRLI